MHRIVILGGGTGGTLTANRLRRAYASDEASITVVDQDDGHVYQPGLLFVPFGLAHPEDIIRPRGRQLHHGIEYRNPRSIGRHRSERRCTSPTVRARLRRAGRRHRRGARSRRDRRADRTGVDGEGLHLLHARRGSGPRRSAFTFFDGGRIVVNVVEMPIKCPVAPLEFCFLADWYFHERGIRDRVELTYVTPLDGAFTKPVASKALGGMLAERGIELVTEFNTGAVDGDGGQARLLGRP